MVTLTIPRWAVLTLIVLIVIHVAISVLEISLKL